MKATADATVRAAPLVAAAMVAMWFVVGVGGSTAQWGDHFEQFAWAHSLEWGYHKHPPLPTWLLGAAIRAFGPSVEWAQVLAVMCTLGTGFFSYRIARELFDARIAALALLLWGLQQPFSTRSHLFNHNSVLMLSVSATAWCLLHAIRHAREIVPWLCAGLLAGLSILAKYQALIPLAGLVIAVRASGELEARSARRGLVAACLVALAVVAPHIGWLVEHEFTTVDYAVQQHRSLAWPARAWSVLSFLVQQVRLVLPALALAALLLALPRRWAWSRATPTDRATRSLTRRQRAWLTGLIAFPLCATVLSGPALGLELQNHWGYQALQFGSLWLAWRVHPPAVSARGRAVGLALLVHAVFLAVALHDTPAPTVRQDALYPARELAEAVRRDWQDDTPCPLAIVVGPTFEAGIVSVYNGGTAKVLEDGEHTKSPWISPSDLQRLGAVHVSLDPGTLPVAGVTRTGSLDVGAAAPAPRNRVYWAIVPPNACEPPG